MKKFLTGLCAAALFCAVSTTVSSQTSIPSGGTAGTAAAQAKPAYKVGDTGPAGGLVFYDKGNNSGGWRYLEAAPADIGGGPMTFATEWILPEKANGEAGRGIGKGKYNTEYIMEIANQKGGGFGWAAQLCDTYEHNGFDDWFLPSRDELNYMYGNLYMRGAGDLRPEGYWSSSTVNMNYAAYFQNFSDGKQEQGRQEQRKYRVRACRQF